MIVNENLKIFYLSVVTSLIIAAVGYTVQFIVFASYFSEKSTQFNLIFRSFRMILGYLIVPLIYKFGYDKNFTFGIEMKYSRSIFVSMVGGISIYLIASVVFVQNDIFTSQWGNRSWEEIWIFLSLIAIMASLTDFWTRGFVLLQLEKYYSVKIAILGQNLLWFVLHIYEIIALAPYIGYLNAILLTLFLGVTGDLIAIHYRNIIGLMLGHVLLNLSIVLAGKGVIS